MLFVQLIGFIHNSIKDSYVQLFSIVLSNPAEPVKQNPKI